MIKFTKLDSQEATKIITSDQIVLNDEEMNEHPIKEIVIKIPAGDIPEIFVERYLMLKDKNGCALSTLDENGKHKFLTIKERYVLKDDGLDININCIKANLRIEKEK